MKIVSIMNFPREPNYLRMCYIFLDSVIAHGARSITIFYDEYKPVVAPEHHRAADIELLKGQSRDLGHPHFNLRFKLPNLANLRTPFLFLDADMVVLSDLHYLWERRKAKPWIGIDHQFIPFDVRTLRTPFLNSGLQLVSDPSFYDLSAILAVQNAAAPLVRHEEMKEEDMFVCPGRDQAVLFRYFRTLGYDYTHPEIGSEWNSCAGVTDIYRKNGVWKAKSKCLQTDRQVHIVHYWDQFKPWKIHCPIFKSYEWADDLLRGLI